MLLLYFDKGVTFKVSYINFPILYLREDELKEDI